MAGLTLTDLASDAAHTDTLFETQFNAIENYINNRNSASADWDQLSVAGTTTLKGAATAQAAFTFQGDIDFGSLYRYRQPNLTYISATAVDIENNTGTANQTRIVFPDGNVRDVTEDTSSTNKYRRFDITATAEFTSGTEDSGLYSGESEANNTWYAIYAVKSAINTSNFVLVGSTTLPTQGNYSTLNSNFGTDGWVYLGVIRNGDSTSTTPGDILEFTQNGPLTILDHYIGSGDVANGISVAGIQLGTNASATSVTWTSAAGTSDLQIPNTIKMAQFTGVADADTFNLGKSTTALKVSQSTNSAQTALTEWFETGSDVVAAKTGTANSLDLHLVAWYDSALAGRGATTPV